MATGTGKSDGDSLTSANIDSMNTTDMRVKDGGVTKNPEESVAVAAGTVDVHEDNEFVTISATTVDLTAAHATNPRRDLISVPIVTGAQTPVKTDGTAGAPPVLPDVPAESQSLVEIKVAPQETLYNDAMTAQGTWTNAGGNFTWDGTANTTTTEHAYEDEDKLRSFNSYLYIKCDMKITTAITTQEMRLHLNTASDSTGDGYAITFDDDVIALEKVASGTPSVLISKSGHAADITYSIEVFRNEMGYWEMYIDGTRVGTTEVKDTTYLSWQFVVMDNDTGTNQKDWDNLVVKSILLSDDLRDDFTDGNFTSDPVWTSGAGSWSAATNELVSSSSSGRISSDLGASVDTTGGLYLRCKFTQSADGSTEEQFFHFNSANDATGDGYKIDIRSDDGTPSSDRLIFSKIGTGSETYLSKGTMGWATTTAKTIECYREPEGRWHVYYNGTEQTGTDANGAEFESTPLTNVRYAVCLNGAQAISKQYDNIRIEARAHKYAYEVYNLATKPQHGQVEEKSTTAADTTTSTTYVEMDALVFANEGYSKLQANITGPLDNGTGTATVRMIVNGKLLAIGNITTSGQDIPMSLSSATEGINGAFVEFLLEALTSAGTITSGFKTKYSVVMV